MEHESATNGDVGVIDNMEMYTTARFLVHGGCFEITENWMRSYNEWRPHGSLGALLPTVYREMLSAEVSSFGLSS